MKQALSLNHAAKKTKHMCERVDVHSCGSVFASRLQPRASYISSIHLTSNSMWHLILTCVPTCWLQPPTPTPLKLETEWSRNGSKEDGFRDEKSASIIVSHFHRLDLLFMWLAFTARELTLHGLRQTADWSEWLTEWVSESQWVMGVGGGGFMNP